MRPFSVAETSTILDGYHRFILFHRKRHPVEMGNAEIGAFLSHLAVEEQVSASTQNQALSALLFLYRDVLGRPIDHIEGVVHAKTPVRLPVVLTREGSSRPWRGAFASRAAAEVSARCPRVALAVRVSRGARLS